MPRNIRKRAIKGTLIVVFGNGMNNALRLAGNLILTRLLVPEMFGLMAIANVVVQALYLFSDIGVHMYLIGREREFRPEELNTAWTINVIRGGGLWALTVVAAWPVSYIYNESSLQWLIPVIGFGFVLDGFRSLAPISLQKRLQLGQVTAMNLSAKFLAVLAMAAFAYVYRSVWALVLGGLVAESVKLIWSYTLMPQDVTPRFTWNKACAAKILHYGKWIFFSTAMSFLATQADRLLLGKLFPLALLGVYSIGAGFAEIPKGLVSSVCSSVMFPVISLFSHLARPDLRKKILGKRRLILLPMALLVAVLAIFGDKVIDLLYDPRYREAGWILPLLALGMWPFLLHATLDRCLYVVDNPKHPAIGNCLKFFYMITLLPFFYIYTGKLGAVLVVAFNDLPVYLVINYGLWKKGLSGLCQDGWATLFLLLLCAVFLYVRHILGWGITGLEAFHGVAGSL